MDTDDWDDDFAPAPQQGGAADPLVNTEYARMQQRYTDVSSASSRTSLTAGRVPRGYH